MGGTGHNLKFAGGISGAGVGGITGGAQHNLKFAGGISGARPGESPGAIATAAPLDTE